MSKEKEPKVSEEELAVREFSDADLHTIAFGLLKDRKRFRGKKALFYKKWQLNTKWFQLDDKPLQEAAKTELQRRVADRRTARVQEFGLDEGLTNEERVQFQLPAVRRRIVVAKDSALWKLSNLTEVAQAIRNTRLDQYVAPRPAGTERIAWRETLKAIRLAYAARMHDGLGKSPAPDEPILVLAANAESGRLPQSLLEIAVIAVVFNELTADERTAIENDTTGGTAAALAFAKAIYRDSQATIALDPKMVAATMQALIEKREALKASRG